MAKPVYSLPLSGAGSKRYATKDEHEGAINLALSALWDAAVVANLGTPEATALMTEFRGLWDDMKDWAATSSEAAETSKEVAEALIWPPLFVFAWGQSNMRGIGEQTGGNQTSNPNVFVWDSQIAPKKSGTVWKVAALGDDPFTRASENPPNNMAFHFCGELQKRTGRQVYLILIAAGGHSIEQFMDPADLGENGWSLNGAESQYAFMCEQIDNGLAVAPGFPTKFDYVIGHHGEANNRDQVEVLARKYRTFFKRLHTRGSIFLDQAEIIMGDILDGTGNGRFKDRHASAIRRLQMEASGDTIPRLKVVSSDMLQPVSASDNIHFRGSELPALGWRYADAAYTEQVPPVLDPTLCDLSVDGGLGWATTQALATTQSTYWGREPIPLNSTPFTIEDSGALGWCYVVPVAGATIYGRKLFTVDAYAQFLMSVAVRNDAASGTAYFRLIMAEYDRNKAYTGLAFGATQTLAPGTQANHKQTFGAPDNGRANDRSFAAGTRFFAPMIQFNWNEFKYAPMKFNFLGMRWI